jgi:hypothetical protein
MKRGAAFWRDETGSAVRAAISAPRRKSLARQPRGAYSAFIDTEHRATKGPNDER